MTPEVVHRVRDPEALAAELVAASAREALDPFTAIAWDHPDNAIDPADPRWLEGLFDASGGSRWFAGLRPDEQARFALERISAFLLVGIEFERGLCEGLIAYASAAPQQSSRPLYIYEEVVEETKHSLMFTTFIGRAAPWLLRLRPDETAASVSIGRRVAELSEGSPMLFLLAVLCGEEPIDHVQRRYLATSEDASHPLLRSICAIHVAEEARHLRFARNELRAHLAEAEPKERARARLFLPQALDRMTRAMLSVPDWLADRWEIPDDERFGQEWQDRDRAAREAAWSKVLAVARRAGIA